MSPESSWRSIARGWWLLLIAVAAGVAGAVTLTVLAEKEYEATTLLRARDAAVATERAEESLDAQLAGVTLARSYATSFASPAFLAAIAPEVAGGTLDGPALEERVTVEYVPETNLISLAVRAESPEAAVALAREVAAAYMARAPTGKEEGEPSDVRPTAPPAASPDPVAPRPVFNIVAGTVLGAIVGLILAWAWGRRRGQVITAPMMSPPGMEDTESERPARRPSSSVR